MQQSRNQATAMIAVLSEAVVSIQARSNGTLIYILRAILKSSSTPSLTPHRFFSILCFEFLCSSNEDIRKVRVILTFSCNSFKMEVTVCT